MNDVLKSFFEKENIECFASCEIPREFVISERRLPEWAKYVCVFLIPYCTGVGEKRNVSKYAVSRDYHLYAKMLEAHLKAVCGENTALFADTSPFDERRLASHLSLGFVGKNGLLINEKYGSFVFVGEIVTEKEISLSSVKCERKECLNCGKCRIHCPTGALSGKGPCMSEITQKKKPDENELSLISKHNLAWGCDICQDVCPHNERACESPIGFFREERIPFVTQSDIENMSDDEFMSRAYSWRGKSVILRNLSLQV